MTIRADTVTFLAALFGRCTTGYLTLTALPPTDGVVRSTPSRHIALDNHRGLTDALDRLAVSNQLGWGACVGIAIRKRDLGRYHRGSRHDLCAIPTLFVDLDQIDTDTEARLQSFPLEPSIRVNSGRGQHLYWLLDRPTNDSRSVDQILRGLAHWLGGDGVHTCATMLRLPGTINTKPDRQQALCHLMDLNPERIYTLSQFAPYRLLPETLSRQGKQSRSWPAPTWTKAEYAELCQRIEYRLIHNYGGFWQRNGWLAALCPLPHQHDRPGLHFGYSPNRKLGHCFGKHGTLAFPELCTELGVL